MISFYKYNGCGNDFIIIDNRREELPFVSAKIAKQLCHRRNGIGADGLLLLENSSLGDVALRIYNSDGSTAEMCGNGLRCFGRCLENFGLKEDNFLIETDAGLLKVHLHQEHVTVEMGDINEILWDVKICCQEQLFSVDHLNTGVPHAVLWLPEIDNFDLDRFGPAIRHHPHFSPQGVNVNICRLQNGAVHLRTYERGVEAETPACGTGAMAAAIVSFKRAHLQPPIKVMTAWNEPLLVDFEMNPKGQIRHLSLSGKTKFLYRGEVEVEYI